VKRKISWEVLDKIEKNKIDIKPKWHFIFYSIFWLFLGGLIFFFSIIVLSFYLYCFNELKLWAVLMNNPLSPMPILLYFSFVLIFFLAIIVALLYRKSRICCRHENWMLFGSILIGLLALSFIANTMGIFEKNFFNKDKEIINIKKYWSNPQAGMLSGTVVRVYYPEVNRLTLHTWSGSEWKIDTEKYSHNNAYLAEGYKIKIIGRKTGDYNFIANQIWAWEE